MTPHTDTIARYRPRRLSEIVSGDALRALLAGWRDPGAPWCMVVESPAVPSSEQCGYVAMWDETMTSGGAPPAGGCPADELLDADCVEHHRAVLSHLADSGDAEWVGACPRGFAEVWVAVHVSGRCLGAVVAGAWPAEAAEVDRHTPRVAEVLDQLRSLAGRISQVANDRYRLNYLYSENKFFQRLSSHLQLVGEFTISRLAQSCEEALAEVHERYELTGALLLTDFRAQGERRVPWVIARCGVTPTARRIESPCADALWNAAPVQPTNVADGSCEPLRQCFSWAGLESEWWAYASPIEYPHRFLTLYRPATELGARLSWERRLFLSALATLHASLSRACALLDQRERDQLRLESEARRRLIQEREELYRRTAHTMGNIAFGIWGSISALPKRLSPNSADRPVVESAVGEVRESYEFLKRTLNQLKQLARVTESHVAPVDLNALIGGLSHGLAAAAGVTISFEPEQALPSVRADAEQLRTAVSELIENSVAWLSSGSHAPPSPAIALKSRRSADGLRAEVHVLDNGPGIPEDQKEQIFEQFYTRRPGTMSAGTGLGLSIVKEIAEAHGGAVVERGRPGEGAHFIITLPCNGDAAVDGSGGQ